LQDAQFSGSEDQPTENIHDEDKELWGEGISLL
jgi:hypothetical protein